MPLHVLGDPAESPNARVEFDYDALDEPQTLPAEYVDKIDFGRRLISYARSKDRARLTLDCLYIALGDAEIEGVSMTEMSQRHGVTKAAISKRVREIREDLHLPRTGFNKTADACEKYRFTNISRIALGRV